MHLINFDYFSEILRKRYRNKYFQFIIKFFLIKNSTSRKISIFISFNEIYQVFSLYIWIFLFWTFFQFIFLILRFSNPKNLLDISTSAKNIIFDNSTIYFLIIIECRYIFINIQIYFLSPRYFIDFTKNLFEIVYIPFIVINLYIYIFIIFFSKKELKIQIFINSSQKIFLINVVINILFSW